MIFNPDVGMIESFMDENHREIHDLYEQADHTGNWSQVARFETSLVLDVLDRTPAAKPSSSWKSFLKSLL